MRRFIIIILLAIIFGCTNYKFQNSLSEILNTTSVEIVNKSVIDEIGGMGEGFAIEEYVLSEKTIKFFVQNKDRILKPKENWISINWNLTPIDTLYSEVYTFGLNYSSGNKNVVSKIDELKKVVSKKSDVYYSFYCKPEIAAPQSIELHLLDIAERKLYIIDASY